MKTFALALFTALSLSPLRSKAAAPSGTFWPSTSPVPEYMAGAPIPNAAGVPTSKNFVPIYEAWEKKVFVEAYRRSGHHDPEIEAFMTDASRCLHGCNDVERAALSTRASAVAARSNDPAVQLLTALVENDPVLREKRYYSAAVGFEKSSYLPFLRFTALANVGQCLAEKGYDVARLDRTMPRRSKL
jgi:hypothetical protein